MLSLVLIVFFGCRKGPSEIPVNGFVHFPIGQRSVIESDIIIEADSIIHEYQIVPDNFGGKWVRIAFDKLNLNTIISIKFTKRFGPIALLEPPKPIPEMWLKPTSYIDADHPSIIEKANHLTTGISGINNKAKNIQLFVSDYLRLQIYKDCGLVSASTTLKNQYGVCINYARLFMALCRATGIPARTVWGSIQSENSYNSHHSWAEFVDEDGYWHPVDMSFTQNFDLNDMRYFDLLYAAEENYHCQDYKLFTVSSDKDYFFYDGSPEAVDGKLNVAILTDMQPDSAELLMTYQISKKFTE